MTQMLAEACCKKEAQLCAKPLLKWAGGKTQLLKDILPRIPTSYGNYIEPFVGGGALFFSLSPRESILADSNPELINMYKQVADNVEGVIAYLHNYENTVNMFYYVRKQDWTQLTPTEAAARMIFLNKTCYNGLYRVNKSGDFNVPFGKYKNPKICDENALRTAAAILKKATILCDDYKTILEHSAQPGDFVFLDPPYLPVSEYADFKRYTKEQFYEEDHFELANEIMRLHEKGCHV
ncbi:MAG: Dam family site-specific DNA-(adenine-N6)-methyltransferase, partial [Clostridiales bacterium]|nr:Dam family site-specific DNA-(adenine-N6)-methyltransferase [Clostridiales bacterium]